MNELKLTLSDEQESAPPKLGTIAEMSKKKNEHKQKKWSKSLRKKERMQTKSKKLK